MTKKQLLLLSCALLASTVVFSACSTQSTTSDDIIEASSLPTSSPSSSIIPSSMPSKESSEKITFPITKLKMTEGTLLKVKVLSASKSVLAETTLLTYSPKNASVTSNGDASLEFELDATNAGKLAALKTPKVTKVLYEVTVDSEGRPKEKELARQ